MPRARVTIEDLRRVGRWEGVSFLVLLGLAMPLKYLFGQPLAVTLVGSVHGALFVWFCWTLARVRARYGWSMRQAMPPFIAAWLPFGPFLIDGALARLSRNTLPKPE